MRKSVEERFWEKVDIGDDDECWEWMACRRQGHWPYGQFGIDGKMRQAHRVAWFLTYGEIPEGMHVLHRCDNPPCCNPAHLFLGTQRDNVADRDAKGRNARGERNNHSVLTEAEVLEIRRLWAEKDLHQGEIGAMFGVAPSTVSNIVHGRIWAHI